MRIGWRASRRSRRCCRKRNTMRMRRRVRKIRESNGWRTSTACWTRLGRINAACSLQCAPLPSPPRTGDRKRSLNEGHIPNFRVARVHVSTGWRAKSAGVAKRPRERSPTRNPSRYDSQLLHRSTTVLRWPALADGSVLGPLPSPRDVLASPLLLPAAAALPQRGGLTHRRVCCGGRPPPPHLADE